MNSIVKELTNNEKFKDYLKNINEKDEEWDSSLNT